MKDKGGQQMGKEPDMISRSEAAKLLKCSAKTVWRYAQKGLLREVKITKKTIRYFKNEVLELLTKGENK